MSDVTAPKPLYVVDRLTGIVLEGPYATGVEKAGDCGPDLDGTFEMPVPMTAAQASAFRTLGEPNLTADRFHLCSNASEPGIYGYPMKESGQNKTVHDALNVGACSALFGDWRDIIPIVDGPCDKIKERLSIYIPPEEPGALAKLWDGLLVGAGFAIAAMILNKVAQVVSGKSILEMVFNGKGGPKNPPSSPPPAAEAAGRSASPSAEMVADALGVASARPSGPLAKAREAEAELGRRPGGREPTSRIRPPR